MLRRFFIIRYVVNPEIKAILKIFDNNPELIKEILEKHFDADDALGFILEIWERDLVKKHMFLKLLMECVDLEQVLSMTNLSE